MESHFRRTPRYQFNIRKWEKVGKLLEHHISLCQFILRWNIESQVRLLASIDLCHLGEGVFVVRSGVSVLILPKGRNIGSNLLGSIRLSHLGKDSHHLASVPSSIYDLHTPLLGFHLLLESLLLRQIFLGAVIHLKHRTFADEVRHSRWIYLMPLAPLDDGRNGIPPFHRQERPRPRASLAIDWDCIITEPTDCLRFISLVCHSSSQPRKGCRSGLGE